MSDLPTAATGRSPIVREALALWAAAFGGLVAAKLLGYASPLVASQVKAIAALLFLYLPALVLRRRDELVDDYAVPPWPWTSREAAAQFRKDLSLGLGTCAVLVPLTVAGFFAFLWLLGELPPELRSWLAPYRAGALPTPELRLPDRFWLHVLDQVLVVALPEEFFYRGYLQTRLSHAFGEGRVRVLGAPLGRAFLLTQVLFAIGHLAELHPWRLGVFFPALLFGWLRARSGSIVPGIVVHAVANLSVMTLEASVLGRP